LIPLVLVVVGFVGGWAVGGQHDASYGAVFGGVVGAAAMVALFLGWERIRSRRL